MRSVLQRALTFSIIVLTVSAAIAADGNEPTPQKLFREQVFALILPDITWEQVREKMRAAFYLTDIDRTGITQATIEKHKAYRRARQRATFVAGQLARDLDGDGTITRAELITIFRRQAEADVRRMRPPPATQAERDRLVADKLEALIAPIMKNDTDGDGRLSMAEMMAAADRQIDERESPARKRGPPMPEWMWAQTNGFVPPQLDPDGDGVLTLDEYDSLVRAIFDEIDADGDGRITAAEAETFFRKIAEHARATLVLAESHRRDAELKAKRAACGLPMLPPSGRFLLIATNTAQALSDVALDSDDAEVGVGQLLIEPGAEPLHLALTSRSPQIWFVTGAVERVETVLAVAWSASAKVPPVGVVGIRPERVHIVAAPSCVPELYLSDKDSGNLDADSRKTADAFETLTGRRPDHVAGANKLATMYLPSARHDDKAPLPSTKELPLTSPGRPMWQWFQRERPLGLVHVDARKVVSRVAARPYELLPGVAGMAQLVDQEALTVLRYSLPFRLAIGGGKIDTIVTPEPDKFKINRKVRIPAEFSGYFVLGRDVPMPDGGDKACIIAEDTDKTIGKRRRCP
jgi:Ca2+-binding EF-hand superfamily protein